MPKYVPEKGDFVRLSFDPQSGYEQKGRRMSCFGRKQHLIQHPNSTCYGVP